MKGHVQATLETLFTAIESLDKQFPGTLDDCRSALRR